MKQILISLLFLGFAYCDKLNNKYLPPDHAQSSAGSQFVQPPIVADLRTRFNEQSPQKSEEYTRVNNQYTSPDGPTNQYSSTSSQYSSLISQKQYPSPNGQNSRANHHFLANGPSGQYSSTSDQFVQQNGHNSSPSSQKYEGSDQYPSTKGLSSQYSATRGQFSLSNGQNSSPNRQYLSPNNQYSGSTSKLNSGFKSQIISPQNQQFKSQNEFQHVTKTNNLNYGASGQNYQPTRLGQSSEQPSHTQNQFQHVTGENNLNYGVSGQNNQPTRFGQSSEQPFNTQNQFQHVTRENNLNYGVSGRNNQPTRFGQSSEQPSNTQNPFQHFTRENKLNYGVSSQNYQPTRVGQSSEQPNRAVVPSSQYGVPSSDKFIQSSSNQQSALQYQSNANPIAILRSSDSPNAGDGSYHFSYETENGITSEEEGSLVNDAETARGGYSYTSPEGESIAVEYVADENGFQPKGAHIPQIPEAILKSIELNKAAEARGENQREQYQASAQSGYQYQGPSGIPQVPKVEQNIPSANGYSEGLFHENQRTGSNGVPSFGGFGVPQGSRQSFSGEQRFGANQDNQGGYRY